MNKILKPFKTGDSITITLTGFIELDKEYLVRKDGNKVIIEPFENLIMKS